MEKIRRRADVILNGEFEKKVFDGVSVDLYLFNDDRIGKVTIGLSNTNPIEFKKEYEVVASLYGKVVEKENGVVINSNRLTVENYELKGDR